MCYCYLQEHAARNHERQCRGSLLLSKKSQSIKVKGNVKCQVLVFIYDSYGSAVQCQVPSAAPEVSWCICICSITPCNSTLHQNKRQQIQRIKCSFQLLYGMGQTDTQNISFTTSSDNPQAETLALAKWNGRIWQNLTLFELHDYKTKQKAI